MIVGGGTAGLTMARRLAKSSAITVAVIEAGGLYELDNGNFSQIPADAIYWVDGSTSMRNPLVDWYQFTEPQPVSLNPSQENKIRAAHQLAGIRRKKFSLSKRQNTGGWECSKLPMVS